MPGYRVLLKGGYYAQYIDVHMFELTDCDYSVTPWAKMSQLILALLTHGLRVW